MSKRLNILPVLMLFFVFLSNISVAIDLTENEKHWLKNHPVIRIGPDPEFPPIEYFNDKGKYIGIAADYMSIIENQLGIKFEVIRYDTWDEVIKAAKDRKIDLLPAAAPAPSRLEYMQSSGKYLTFNGVIITEEDENYENLNQLKDKRVGVVKNYVWEELLKDDSVLLNIIPVENVSQGLKNIATGDIDAMIATLPIALYYIKKEGIINLSVSGTIKYQTHLSVLVRNDWPIFNTIISKAIASISNEKKADIYNKWITVEKVSFYQKYNVKNIILIVSIQLFFILIIFFLWKFYSNTEENIEAEIQVKRNIYLLIVFLLFIVLNIFIILDEVLDIPYLVFGAEETLVNYTEIFFESGLLYLIGIIIYYFLYKALKVQRHIQFNLIESKNRYLELFENSPVALWEEDFSELNRYLMKLGKKGVVDMRNFFINNPEELILCVRMIKVLDVNKATLSLTDANTKNELFKQLDITFTNKTLDIFREAVIAIAEKKSYFRSESQIRTLKGEIRYVDLMYYAQQKKDNKVALVSMVDISDRKMAERKIIESEEKFRAFFESSIDFIILKNENFEYLMINDAYQRYLGLEKSEIIGKKDVDILFSDLLGYNEFNDRRVLKNGETIVCEEKGKGRSFETTKFPVNLSGNKTGIGVIIRDITEKKKSEKELDNYQRHLQMMVNKRTEELESKNAELKRLNDIFVDREFRIKELKSIIENLQRNDANKL